MAVSVVEADRWTWSLIRKRFAEIFHEGGVRSLWFKILGEIAYRRLLLLERSLKEPIPEIRSRLPVTIGLLEATETDEYLRFRPGTTRTEIRRRFEARQRCFVARYRGHLVGTSWAADTRAWSHYLSREIDLLPDEIYIYDSYSRPDCRGRLVASAIGVEILRYFRAAGYRRIIRAISPENQASLRVAAGAGYRPFGKIGYIAIGPWRKHFSMTRTEI